MNHFNPETNICPRVLASDLDGTLIPLPDSPENERDLECIKSALADQPIEIVFATGRHFESVVEAIKTYRLPTPDWIVCDVGSAIYRRVEGDYQPYQAYREHLCESVGGVDREQIEILLADIQGLKLQPADHQQEFKISYMTEPDTVEEILNLVANCVAKSTLPYGCMGSLDPFMNCGLIDVMPKGVSKAFALLWLSTHADFTPDEVIYAGDSGNDYAALVSGFRAIVVSNHSNGLDKNVGEALAKRDLSDRAYMAKGTATSGVLEGCRHFGLIETAFLAGDG